MLSRRSTLASGFALAACANQREPAQEDRVAGLMGLLEQNVGGRIGVAALDTETGAAIHHRGDERFAMCSTFKWLLAAAALERLDRQELLQISAGDIMFHSPVVEANLSEGAMSVEALCEAIIVQSDNAGANILLRRLGGPAALTSFLRSSGDQVTRIDRYEPDLAENAPGDPRDTTTPNAMVATMRRFLVGRTLQQDNRDSLIEWFIACQTGLTRLRAGLPVDWRAGDKTGTGGEPNNATNDVAIVWPPKRAPILIACYMSHSAVVAAERNAAQAQIARLVAAAWS